MIIRLDLHDPETVFPQKPEDFLDIHLRVIGDLLGAGAGPSRQELENRQIVVLFPLDASGTEFPGPLDLRINLSATRTIPQAQDQVLT